MYVIDNASTDDSLDAINAISDRVLTIRLEENLGFAGGYNEGLKDIDAEYFFLLNSDVEVSEHWLQPLEEALDTNSDVGVVAPRIRSWKNREYFEYAGAAGGFLDRHGYAFCRGRVFDTVEVDSGQYDNSLFVAWAGGCCLGIRSSLYKGLEGFDESFFAHYEEIDLCCRIRRAGYRILCNPQSVVYHLGGGTMEYNNPKKSYLNFRNSLSTIYKNHNGRNMWSRIFSRLILDGIAAVMFLTKGQFKSIVSIFRAHISFYSNLSKLNSRKKIEASNIERISRGPTCHDGEYQGSVVWSYFIEKKATFTEIVTEQ